MLKYFGSLIALASFSSIALPQAKPEVVQNPDSKFKWELGFTGKFEEGDYFLVKRVIGPNVMIVEGHRKMVRGKFEFEETIHNEFLLCGPATGGIVDGQKIKLSKNYKITHTNEQFGKKMFMAEEVEEPKKEAPKPMLNAEQKKAAEDKAKEQAKEDAKRQAVAAKEKSESDAAGALRLARTLLKSTELSVQKLGKQQLKEITEKYPNTAAGKEAAELLKPKK